MPAHNWSYFYTQFRTSVVVVTAEPVQIDELASDLNFSRFKCAKLRRSQ
jgi:hypothetical protein